MDSKGKVSIIIGCYNVSRWLKDKKLSCILNQTYSNIEVILVNDGSTDDTLALCNSLKEVDDRIIIITKENGGLGSARNIGLDNASGEYVWFYDVDDEVELNLVEKNIDWMSLYQTDLNVFGYWCIIPSQNLTQEVSFKKRLIENNDQLKAIFVDELFLVPNGNGFAWNKFYRRSFIEKYHFRFGNQRIQQDELFNVQLYPQLSRVYISSELLYHYYIYLSGNTRSRFIPNRYDIYVSIYKGLKDFSTNWGLNDQRLSNYINNRLYWGLNTSVLFNTFHKDSHYSLKEKKEVIIDLLNREETKLCLNNVNLKNKSLEHKLYLMAYRNESFITICLLRFIYNNLRLLKHLVEKYEITRKFYKVILTFLIIIF